MSSQTDQLKAVVASIVPQIQTAITTEGQLKTKLEAALADNVAKAAQITDLQAQLAAAQAGQANPADAVAVTDAATALQAVLQPLADANAVNAPGN